MSEIDLSASLPGWSCSCGKNKTPSSTLCTSCIAKLKAQIGGGESK